jgi:hypothetical protein
VYATFARQVRQQAVQRAKRARRQALLLLPLIVGVFVAYRYREHLFGYTQLSHGEDRIMVPNNVVLAASVVPLREPSGVDVLARLDADMKPSEVQRVLDETVAVPTRSDPHVGLEEFDGDEVVVRVAATPLDDSEGPKLADQVVAALSRLAADEQPQEEVSAR